MSLSDESFPEHDLHITTIDRKCNVSLCTSLSAGDNDGNISASTSGQSLSGNSRETTQSDPAKNPEIRDEEDYAHKVRSCQDLHSAYTKRRYSHVKSKVREFIESQKAEEEHRRSAREYIRRMSIPEAINSNGLELQNLPQKPMSCLASVEGNPSDIDRDLVEKEQEMMCLKALNEYLQSSLQEKMIEATRLRRRLDGMRIELMNAKDKAKRHSMHSIGIDVRNHYSPRLSLPTLIYKLPRNTTGTQTDFVQSPPDANNNSNSSSSSNAGQYESKNVATIQPITLNFSTDHLGHYQRQMRRRPNSNPSTPTGNHTADSKPDSDRSDSAIDTEEADSSSENVLREQFMISEKGSNDTTSSNLPNQKKKRRYFKRKWKWIFGSCGKCSDQKNNSSFGEQYSQTPLLDSAFADRLRPLDNNTSL